MTFYYLDLETTGIDPEKDDIVTIQFKKLGFNCRISSDPLIILKSWESSEKEIVSKFHEFFMRDTNVWNFVPVGNNLIFEFKFLFSKFEKYGLHYPNLADYFYKKPNLDTRTILVISNYVEFKGSGLDRFTSKSQDGSKIPEMFKNKEYEKIEEYIGNEAKGFLDLLELCINKFPSIIKCKI